MRFVHKIIKWGGRNNVSYGIIIPKEIVTGFELHKEKHVILETDEFKQTILIKKIPYG